MKSYKEFIRSSLVYLFSNVTNAALPFILLPVLIRQLGAAEYGRIGLITSAFSLILVVTGLGSQAYLRVQINKSSPEQLKQILGNTILAVGTSSVLISIPLLLFSLFFTTELPVGAEYIVFCSAAVFGQAVVTMQLVLWQMDNRPLLYGLLMLTMTLTNLSLSILLVLELGMGAEGRIVGIWLPLTMAGPLVILKFIWRDEVNFLPSRAVLRDLLNYGLPLIPHSVALTFLAFYERYVLSRRPDPEDLGIYFAAVQLAMPLSIFIQSINLQFRPWSDLRMAQSRHLQVVNWSYALILLFALIASIYAFLLQFIAPLITGIPDSGINFVAILLVFSAMFKGFYLVVAKGLQFSGHTRVMMRISVSLVLLFSLLLLYFNSLQAVAFLNLLFHIALFSCIWAASSRLYPQPWGALPRKAITCLPFLTNSRNSRPEP